MRKGEPQHHDRPLFLHQLPGLRRTFVAPSKKVQIDVRLDEIVLRALEKTPELRYQTAGEFRTVLETMAQSSLNPDIKPEPPLGRSLLTRSPAHRTARFWHYASPGAFLLVYAGLLLLLATTTGLLPPRVASHFGAEGKVDGWMNRASYLAIMGCMPLLFGGVAVLISWLTFGIHTLMLVGLAGTLMIPVQHFMAMIRDMGSEIPLLTRLVIGTAEFTMCGGYLLVPVLIAMNLPLCWLADRLGGRKLLVGWAVLGVLVFLGLGILIVGSIFLTTSRLIGVVAETKSITTSLPAEFTWPNVEPLPALRKIFHPHAWSGRQRADGRHLRFIRLAAFHLALRTRQYHRLIVENRSQPVPSRQRSRLSPEAPVGGKCFCLHPDGASNS